MKLSKSSKKNLRYLSIANPYFCLRYLFSNSSQSYFSCNLKTLVSPKPSPIPSLNSDQFQSKPTSNPSYSFISSIGSSSFCHLTHPSCHSSQNLYFSVCNGSCRSQISKLGLLTSRCISSFAMVNGPYATPKQVSEIIELLRSGDSETESKLLSMSVSLSNASVIEILRVLNSEKVSALCFLKYMREIMPEFYKNSDICSLVIDNCGRLDDYETMRQLLNEFNVYQVCLNEKAFGFLPVLISSKALTKKCIWRVVEVLNQVEGSCLVSGVRALIEMFSVLGLYEMAKYVIKKTERKVSYYNILIKEMCRRCDFKGPRDLLVEMRQVGCEPITLTYNYVLGVLCKNGQDADACELLEEMLGRNCHPDAITYEIFIVYSCRVGKFDVAFNFFNQMVKRGLQPRLTTHAAFIKGYFSCYRYEDAYKYVVLSADKYKSSSNMLYSLLASLHDKNNNPVMAKNVLSEMMKIGLRPNVSVYRRVLKHLHTSRQEHMAKCLSSSTRVSNELGAGNPKAAKMAVCAIIILAAAEMVTVSIVLLFCRHILGYALSSSENIVHRLADMVPFICLSIIMDSLQAVLSGVARGSGWQKIGAFVNLGAYYLVGIPIAAVLAFVFQLKGKGLLIGLATGSFVQAALLALKIVFTDWGKQASKARERIFEGDSQQRQSQEIDS